MKVVLLSYTKDAERLCAAAARSCYSQDPASKLLEEVEEGKAGRLIDQVVERGHHSVIEHASYTFSLEGVSRSLTHQLVRHRIASYSQQSQRYVPLLEPSYVAPETVRVNAEANRVFEKAMEDAWEAYRQLATLVPVEDARYVLPNACATNIVVTMNARELWHFFTLRTCRRAQQEIRTAAELMLAEVRKVSPALFKDAGPACLRGKCPEGKLSCGRPRVELKYK
ncbi:MAG TPA: FAD-dependent thymidylate synthase [Methanomassiliicoccales archaeon]|nr:FAD-dependent thymidylate synthase [Methanomassiliicoccales archaeon]